MSPEFYENKIVGRAADIWALACILYQLITWKVLFPGNKKDEVAQLVLNSHPSTLNLPQSYRKDLRLLIHCMLRNNVDERPSSASEILKEKLFGEELEQLEINLSVEHQGPAGSVSTMVVKTSTGVQSKVVTSTDSFSMSCSDIDRTKEHNPEE